MGPSVPPDRERCEGDPGDDTYRRYRYQSTYAAILCLALLDDQTDFSEVFCEHHEDVLIRCKNGRFVGMQFKTRDLGREPFEAGDEQIQEALSRFISLDARYTGWFSRFVLASNAGFWQEKTNSSNLVYLLGFAKAVAAQQPAVPAALDKFVSRLAKKTGQSGAQVLDVLKRVQIQNTPGLDDIDNSLIHTLSRCPLCCDWTYLQLKGLADQLTLATFRASSLAHQSAFRDYVAFLDDPQAAIDRAIIDGKRMTADGVRSLVGQALTPEASLCPWQSVNLDGLPKGMRRMGLKMSLGGVSATNVDLARDHKTSADLLVARWLQRYGRKRATEQFEHLRTLVRSECQEAYDQYRTPDRPFGQTMLMEVRRRLRARHERDSANLYGCAPEHLLGVAGILTEDCVLWWGEPFDLPEEVV
jgi:hypothetical protein